MNLEYVPLLRIQRELHDIPRGLGRFRQYLRTIMNESRSTVELPSLLAMNPMGREHVTELLDALLAMDADAVAARAVAKATAVLAQKPWDFKVALVVADDLKGGWTNRYATEFTHRFGPDHLRSKSDMRMELPRWLDHFWITALLWSSEPASERAVREAILTAVYRMAYMQRHGPALTLGAMMSQEGKVMAQAGCTEPTLDADDLAYTREVLIPYLDATDMRTAIECLFGDAAARTLGFTPRGLSPWAGLALALYDERPIPISGLSTQG